MDFLTRVVRYLFWLLVLSWSMWLLKKVLAWMLQKATPAAQGQGEYHRAAKTTGTTSGIAGNELTPRKLVRDPVCGTYLAEVLAIPMRERGDLLHFCSTACRDKYAASAQRKAANA